MLTNDLKEACHLAPSCDDKVMKRMCRRDRNEHMVCLVNAVLLELHTKLCNIHRLWSCTSQIGSKSSVS